MSTEANNTPLVSVFPGAKSLTHVAPLKHLVRETIHKGRTLEERVRLLRYRRRKPKVAPPAPGEVAP